MPPSTLKWEVERWHSGDLLAIQAWGLPGLGSTVVQWLVSDPSAAEARWSYFKDLLEMGPKYKHEILLTSYAPRTHRAGVMLDCY